MDDVALGRTLRAIRQRLGLRQADVAAKGEVSQQLVSKIEAGLLRGTSMRVLRQVAGSLGAELVVSVRWHGADLDRLRDEVHARLVAEIAVLLEADGWLTAPEVTYSWYGERGSIDLLAFHPRTRTLLVIEAKSEVVSVEETLRRHDQKVRLAARVALDRFGWEARSVGRLLAVRDGTTARRRVARHDAVFGRAYPIRGWAARAWLAAPTGPAGLLMFLPATTGGGAGPRAVTVRRVRVPRPRSETPS